MKNHSKNIIITVHELLFFISFSVLFIMKGVGIYEGMLAFNISIVVSFLSAGIAMLMADYTIPEFIGAIALLGCSFLAYFETGEKAVIAAVLMVIGMKNVSLERMMKLAFGIWTICFYGMLFVHLMGWKEDIILAHNKFGLGFILRRSLGFPHPNVLHISFIIWMALFLYIWKGTGKKLFKTTIVLGLANIFMFFYSISVTGMGLGFIYLFCNYYFTLRTTFNKLEKGLIKAVLPICILMCTIPPLYFEGRLFDLLNKLINSRMRIWKYYLTNFVPGVFGTKVYSPEEGLMSLDGSYLYLLYYYGWIFFAFFVGATFWTICRCIKKGHKKELAIILGLSIAGIVEPFLYNFSAKNIILIFVGYEIFDAMKIFQGRTVNFLPWGKKEVQIGIPDITIESVEETWRRLRKRCVIVGGIIGIVALIYTALNFEIPRQIYVRTERCDYMGGPGIVLSDLEKTLSEIENPEECWILGYQNEETRFYSFDGNMITLEYFRGIIVSGVMGFCVGSGIIIIFDCFKKSKLNKKRNSI